MIISKSLLSPSLALPPMNRGTHPPLTINRSVFVGITDHVIPDYYIIVFYRKCYGFGSMAEWSKAPVSGTGQ